MQRAADALLRQGTKPSVVALREQLGGGSPNRITPLLAKYWETLGARLEAGPESFQRVPESLREIVRAEYSRGQSHAGFFSRGSHNNVSDNVSYRHVTEAAVLASEIEQLPDLAGFLKLALSPSWLRVVLTPP